MSDENVCPWPVQESAGYWMGWDAHARGHSPDDRQSAEFQRGWHERAAYGIEIYDTRAVTKSEWETQHLQLRSIGWTIYDVTLGVCYLRKPFVPT